MYCKHCLAANPAGATKCVQCGAALADAITGASPASNPINPSELELQDHGGATPPIAPPPPETGAATDGPYGGPEGGPGGSAPPVRDPIAIPLGGPIGGPPPLRDEDPKKPKVEPPPLPPDNKSLAIAALIVPIVGVPCACCMCYGLPSLIGMVFGLLALLESGKVKQYYEDGAHDASILASNRTKTFAYIGLGVFLGLLVLGFVISLALHGLSFLTNWQGNFDRYR